MTRLDNKSLFLNCFTTANPVTVSSDTHSSIAQEERRL